MSKMTVLIIQANDVTAETMQKIAEEIGYRLQCLGEQKETPKPQAPVTLVASPMPLRELEIDAIRLALEVHNGNREATAKALGIGERTLYRKIKGYKLDARK